MQKKSRGRHPHTRRLECHQQLNHEYIILQSFNHARDSAFHLRKP